MNPVQKEAVLHVGSHLLIVAGPGTGKTMTLSHRIAHLIDSGRAGPAEILALTFTNKAAREMRERVNALLLGAQAGDVQVHTFHGFCLDVLRNDGEMLNLPRDFTLCPEFDAPDLARDIISKSDASKKLSTKFLKNISQMKIDSVMAKEHDSSHNDLLPLFVKYQQKLRDLEMLDLDDLEVETFRLFANHPDVCLKYATRYPKIFVDEYQDTNAIQVALLKMLANSVPHSFTLSHEPCAAELCAIGDPDQAIYGFRGADLRYFHSFFNVEISRKKSLNTVHHSFSGAQRFFSSSAVRPQSLQTYFESVTIVL